jgi:AraC-like DNA-binding protein
MGSFAPPRSAASHGAAGRWQRLRVAYIEDLKDAVRGAGLEATQLSAAPLSGSLVHAEHRGVVYNSGLIGGRVSLKGPLSQDRITLGLGLRLVPGTRQWLAEVPTGAVGLFLPGDEHDALYPAGSLYLTATLDAARLEEEAARADLVLDCRRLGGSGIHPRRAPSGSIPELSRAIEGVHAGRASSDQPGLEAAERTLALLVAHYAREPRGLGGPSDRGRHSQIFRRAQAYILENLEEPISIDALCDAVAASRRTLHRAFLSVIDESPQAYVRRLRLHRIRHDLASESEAACTVALVANRWGIGELGRLAGLYRELFGELPSQTLARRKPAPGLAA